MCKLNSFKKIFNMLLTPCAARFLALRWGGGEPSIGVDFRRIDLGEKFRSLAVEKNLIIFSTETLLRLIFAHSPRPLWEREEFQVELERNLEIRVRGLNNKKSTPSLALPAGEGIRVVVQLAHTPRPLAGEGAAVLERCRMW